MSGYLNKVQLLGNLGQNPEIRQTQDGTKIATLSVATNEYWKDKKTGERKEKAEWHRVVIFNPRLSEIAEKYLHKGSKVYIEGQLQTRKWDDKGQDRYTTEIVLQQFRGELMMMDGKEQEEHSNAMNEAPTASYAQVKGRSGDVDYSTIDKDLDDEIPF